MDEQINQTKPNEGTKPMADQSFLQKREQQSAIRDRGFCTYGNHTCR